MNSSSIGGFMKKRLFLTAALACFFMQCRTTQPLIHLGGYDFDYQGQEYRIESVTPTYREGYNLLLQKEDQEVVFMATDREQDGEMDIVNTGDLSLEEARTIYRAGIREGYRRGYIKARTFGREYKTSVDISNYVLATYVLAMGDIYNKLTMTDISREEAVLIDDDADGVLDTIEKGVYDLKYYQEHYRIVLNRGLTARKIEKKDGRFLVVE